jgi:ketosteroid isomerase-like protein
MSLENASNDLDHVVEQQHLALDEFVRGDHEPLERLYSQRDDVTLGNPFGPFARGFEHVVQTMQRAASHYRDGEATGFELVAKHVTPDLACLVEVERFKAKVAGREDVTPLSLRVTSIFRREDGVWKLVHRHADPITAARPAESVMQT